MNDPPGRNTDAYYRSRPDDELRGLMTRAGVDSPDWQGARHVLADRAAERQERLTRNTFWAAIAALLVSIVGILVTIFTAG